VMHARGIVVFLDWVPWGNVSTKGFILFGLSLQVTKRGPLDASLGVFMEKPSQRVWHFLGYGLRHVGVVLLDFLMWFTPSEADAALFDATICLLAFGNVGCGSFDSSVVSCGRECV